MTFETTRNAISSPASAVGAMRSGSPAGPTTGPCGPDRVLANLSPRQALEKGLMTRDTYGRTGDGSSISAGLQSSLESRLRAKMAAYGSPRSEERRVGKGCRAWWWRYELESWAASFVCVLWLLL